ncbi:collagen-like protein [Lapidilactobacillus wuchangensis]|uniref:collagen-like protein n=1 Tax=Lapidilactobacillus wuchangensis TaxID=2486001 RepID=UPI000F799A0A|nr:collagen-like protein [Lapidilactobacillus wuchangensis]
MTEIVKVMQTDTTGNQTQVYPQTHVDAIVGLDDEIKNHITAPTAGNDGLSAYEIAVKDGFSGTEVQWLASLKGTNGTNATTTSAATSAANGLMSAADKKKLDSVPVISFVKVKDV